MLCTIVKAIEETLYVDFILENVGAPDVILLGSRLFFPLLPEVDADLFEGLCYREGSHDRDYERCSHEELKHRVLEQVPLDARGECVCAVAERADLGEVLLDTIIGIELLRLLVQFLNLAELKVSLPVRLRERYLRQEQFDGLVLREALQQFDADITLRHSWHESVRGVEELHFRRLRQLDDELQELGILILLQVIDVVKCEHELLQRAEYSLDQLAFGGCVVGVEAQLKLIMLVVVVSLQIEAHDIDGALESGNVAQVNVDEAILVVVSLTQKDRYVLEEA